MLVGSGEGMSGMASAVKKSETEKFSRSVATVATAVQGLVECTAQAAYLVSSLFLLPVWYHSSSL